MNRRHPVIIIFIIVCIPLFFSHSRGEETKSAGGQELTLSREFQRLLAAEMNAIQNGMTDLVMAIPAGQWDTIVVTARSMNETYIINKKLSGKEKAEFESSLPKGYRDIDTDFKELTSGMIHAAEQRNMEKVSVLFHRLMENCLQCHSQHAKTRFPDLDVPVK